MEDDITFADACTEAAAEAARVAHPYTPSRAQQEQALAPLLGRLLSMPDAKYYIGATFACRSCMPLAVHLYKDALATAHLEI